MTAAASNTPGAALRPGAPRTNRWACSQCGCTQGRACAGGCFWAAYKKCSKCATSLELKRVIELGPAALWPARAHGHLTLAEIAAAQGVNKKSLRVRIWNSGKTVADGRWLESKVWVDTFSPAAVKKIKAILAADPIHAGRGHKPKKGKI